MKLLFDQNLSPDLPRLLADLFPESLHVRNVAMRESGDDLICDYAKSHDFTVVTKDKDYQKLSRILGPPPKVILITSGNGPTSDVESLLRARYANILALQQDEVWGLLELPLNIAHITLPHNR